ncbi:MAG: diphthine synthase [Candidatus Thermoplasmatota archaeon]|nr:diphthine synthase [Candidatus Thermoplasmatota archaeon]
MTDPDAAHLSLVGLGVGPRGISLAGLEAARNAQHVFLEGYTALAGDTLEELEALLDNEVQPVGRAVVEGQTRLLEAARDGGCCLLVVGDPLSATTHTALEIEAKEQGIPVTVRFGASILTAAAGILGLSHYKFGRTTTLVTPRGAYFPESPYEVVRDNLAMGLHTLVLLDIREDGTCMTGPEGAQLLLDLEVKREEGVLDEGTLGAIVARAGFDDQQAWSGSLTDLSGLDCGAPMHTIVVPGEMSEFEADALERLTHGP